MSGQASKSISVEAAEHFLVERFGKGVRDVARIAHGEWSSAFSFELSGEPRIIRFGEHRDDYERDRYAATLSTPALPVPQILEIGWGQGRHYAVSERAFGVYLDDLDGPAFAAALPRLFEALDAMRAVVLPTRWFGDLDGRGSASKRDWRAHLFSVAEPSERLPGWRERVDADREACAIFDEAFTRLQSIAPHDVEPHLVHADLLNFNVLIDGDKPAAILDWGCAMAGDSLYDLAWLMFCQFWYPAWAGIDILTAARGHFERMQVEVDGMERRLQACLLHIGLGSLRYNGFAARPEGVRDACRRLREVMDGLVVS